MKTQKALFFTIPFLLFMLTVSSCPAYASQNDETYYCSTAEELYETLNSIPEAQLSSRIPLSGIFQSTPLRSRLPL